MPYCCMYYQVYYLTHCDFDPVLSHYIPSQLLYPFIFVTLTLNVFLHSFAWIDQDDWHFGTNEKICNILKNRIDFIFHSQNDPSFPVILLGYNNKNSKTFFFPRFFFLEKTISLVANQLYWSSSLAYIFDLPSKSFSLVRHFFDSLFKKGWWYNSSIIDSNFIWKYSNMASSQYFVILMRQVLQQRC